MIAPKKVLKHMTSGKNGNNLGGLALGMVICFLIGITYGALIGGSYIWLVFGVRIPPFVFGLLGALLIAIYRYIKAYREIKNDQLN